MAGAPTGGAELFYERLSLCLARSGEAVLPVIRRDADRAARLRTAGLAPVELRFGGPLDLLTTYRLGRALRRFAPDVAVAWMSRATRFAPRGRWVLVGRLGGYYDLRYYRHCDHLVGNTQGIVDWIIGQGWQADRVHHVPNFAPDLLGATPLPRAALGVPDGAPMILALGRLHHNKAFDVLIRALRSLPGVHAVIAGEGPERNALTALARDQGVAGRLHLPGWRTDTAALLATADVLVCPSRLEPLGNVVIEAWSAGRPVVAAAADGPRELITPDRDGVLVAPDSPDQLVVALRMVLQTPALSTALAEAGRARYEAGFAEAPVVARWRRFLATVEKPRGEKS